MKQILVAVSMALACFNAFAIPADTNSVNPASVLIVPYKPAMHFSDSDPHIAMGSEMELPEMRSSLRTGLIQSLNRNFADVYDVKAIESDFVKDNSDMEALYHSLMYESDSVYTLKNPKRFAVKDSAISSNSKKRKSHYVPDVKYINIDINDQMLLPELSEKYNADYFIFINELDIITNYDDCMNFALKIYRRDLKVHYTIFDKHGRQIYGDVAVSHFDSNSNDVNEIVAGNFPGISDYMLKSFDKAVK